MSDHIRSREQISGLGAADHSAIFPDTPEDSDLEDSDSLSVSGAASTRHRDLFPPLPGLGTGSRNHSGALYILSRSKKQFQVVLLKVASELHPKIRNHGEGPY